MKNKLNLSSTIMHLVAYFRTFGCSRVPLFLLAFLLLTAGAQANSGDALASARADLQEALDQLATERESIRAQEIPLARQLRELETEVAQLRSQAARLARQQDARSINLEALQREVRTSRDEQRYIDDQCIAFLRDFEARVSVAEWPTYKDLVRAALESESSTDTTRLDAVERLAERVYTLSGKRRFSGEAIDADGIVYQGYYLAVGPYLFFADPEQHLAGWLPPTERWQPRVHNVGDSGSIQSAVIDGTGTLPFDPTLGDALSIRESRVGPFQRIRAGGMWIWPILTFALLAFVVAIIKAVQILRISEPSTAQLNTFTAAFQRGDEASASTAADAMGGPIGRVLKRLAATIGQRREVQEEVAFEQGLKEQMRLERWLPFLALAAATTPLLGLLGTVTGMIKTFNLIQIFGTGDAGRLAGGISEALVTTEFGLLVAIPCLIAHAFLARRAQGILTTIEAITGSLLHTSEEDSE